MKVVLVNPPWVLKKDMRLLKLHSLTPPLGLCYIAAVLERKGADVEIVDGAVARLSVEDVAKKVIEKNPDIVGFTATTPLAYTAIETIKLIKESLPNVKTVFGGSHMSAIPKETMESCKEIDIGVVGEGEMTMLDIVNGVDLKDIKGTVFRNNVEVVQNPAREPIKNLDELPFPARHLLPDLKLYNLAPSDYQKLPVTTMITSRGCPYNCVYCNKQIFGRLYRCNSAEYVISEIKHLIENFGIEEIKIWDDVFTISKERTEKICETIIKEKLDIGWSCETRVNLVDKEMLAKMKESGCWCIDYGIESGNQEILDRARKGITIEQIRNAVKWTKEAGIKSRGYFMIGLPGDTEESIRQTINFAKELDLDFASFFSTTPFPGTDLFKIAEEEGCVLTKDWSSYYTLNEKKTIFVPKTVSKEKMNEMLIQAYKEFYFRPNYILKTIVNMRNINDLKRVVGGAFTFLFK